MNNIESSSYVAVKKNNYNEQIIELKAENSILKAKLKACEQKISELESELKKKSGKPIYINTPTEYLMKYA